MECWDPWLSTGGVTKKRHKPNIEFWSLKWIACQVDNVNPILAWYPINSKHWLTRADSLSHMQWDYDFMTHKHTCHVYVILLSLPKSWWTPPPSHIWYVCVTLMLTAETARVEWWKVAQRLLASDNQGCHWVITGTKISTFHTCASKYLLDISEYS